MYIVHVYAYCEPVRTVLRYMYDLLRPLDVYIITKSLQILGSPEKMFFTKKIVSNTRNIQYKVYKLQSASVVSNFDE